MDFALKIKWKRKKHTFTEEELEKILNPIGKVDTIAIAEKKKGTALVVFKTVVDAVSLDIIIHITIYNWEKKRDLEKG